MSLKQNFIKNKYEKQIYKPKFKDFFTTRLANELAVYPITSLAYGRL